MKDIRDKLIIRHEDVVALNFIKDTGRYVFRRHHLNGLRSHIMEMLAWEDVKKENQGVYVNGIRQFPISKPIRMLRIFRKRFLDVEEILDEIKRFQIVGKYLTETHLAMSEEFIADYVVGKKHDILLCGLQEYVEGECLDPWKSGTINCIENIAQKLEQKAGSADPSYKHKLIRRIKKNIDSFVETLKRMVREVNYIPDLAGNRNILITSDGHVKLVDINNISYVSSDGCILVDDFDYPVCDKSIEALLLIERNLLKRGTAEDDPFYRLYLQPERLRKVEKLAHRFYNRMLKFSGTKNV
jgi:hypothetical protein